MEEARKKNNSKTIDELSQKAVALAKTLGPEYQALIHGAKKSLSGKHSGKQNADSAKTLYRNVFATSTLRKMATEKVLVYRKNAELCEEEAERAPTAYFAEQFRKLAQHWRELAEYAEDKGF
jgi:hypothetical protein